MHAVYATPETDIVSTRIQVFFILTKPSGTLSAHQQDRLAEGAVRDQGGVGQRWICHGGGALPAKPVLDGIPLIGEPVSSNYRILKHLLHTIIGRLNRASRTTDLMPEEMEAFVKSLEPVWSALKGHRRPTEVYYIEARKFTIELLT